MTMSPVQIQSKADIKSSIVIENPDRNIVDAIRKSLKERDGFCPCSPKKTPDTICPCKNFRDKIKDPSYSGFCHCRLYYKPARVIIIDYDQKDNDNTEYAGGNQ